VPRPDHGLFAVTMKEEERKEIERLTALLEAPKKANVALRSWYKLFLEYIRNCMVVAALFYLAQKSGDWWLYVIAAMSGLALGSYCYTYIENWWPDVNVMGRARWKTNLMIAASTLALQLVLLGITIGMVVTLNKIVETQAR
jgi:uncharacterized membrane protein